MRINLAYLDIDNDNIVYTIVYRFPESRDAALLDCTGMEEQRRILAELQGQNAIIECVLPSYTLIR